MAGQLSPADQHIVVGDGWQPLARRMCGETAGQTQGSVVYMEASHPSSRYGNHGRDVALQFATGSHVMFLDDDDVYEPGALASVRAAIANEDVPNSVHVFRATWGAGHHWHGTLWAEPVFRVGNVATCMVVYPRDRLPLWMAWNDLGIVSDFGWMTAAAEGRAVEFHEQVVATVRPEARA